ncbi:hypothetical protein MES5069_360124 [Mesorhizobium escarrei]|uniref:Transposase n=1 Tax=Mesorhizobium escarrei TaxID=666018 RepID=A0ABN8JYE0_9HYPH|nr:hypothetical protein MES5069_360124 [Mesorhizobium escarrei]
MDGHERRHRWSEEDQCRILAAPFAPGATVAVVARQYDVANSLIYKWRRTVRARETGFTDVVVVPDEPVAVRCRRRHQRDRAGGRRQGAALRLNAMAAKACRSACRRLPTRSAPAPRR